MSKDLNQIVVCCPLCNTELIYGTSLGKYLDILVSNIQSAEEARNACLTLIKEDLGITDDNSAIRIYGEFLKARKEAMKPEDLPF